MSESDGNNVSKSLLSSRMWLVKFMGFFFPYLNSPIQCLQHRIMSFRFVNGGFLFVNRKIYFSPILSIHIQVFFFFTLFALKVSEYHCDAALSLIVFCREQQGLLSLCFIISGNKEEHSCSHYMYHKAGASIA